MPLWLCRRGFVFEGRRAASCTQLAGRVMQAVLHHSNPMA